MVLNAHLFECIENTHVLVTKRKGKEKKQLKETPTSNRKPKKGKEEDHLKKTSLGPLRQGQRLDTSEIKICSSKEHKPPIQSSKTTKSSPCTHASSPEPLQLPLDECMQTTSQYIVGASALLLPVRPIHLTGQIGGQDRLAPGNHTGQIGG
jgi:hypothetical protein